MAEVSTIDDVLLELDNIVETTVNANSLLGIFAFVYRRTTAAIAEGIHDGRFENNVRMERFDVEFARKYIEAYWRYQMNKPVPISWKVAFDAAVKNEDRPRPTIIQHLLLGMNAHINLDLAIAAAEVAPGNQITALKEDFMTINDVLQVLIDEIQARLSRVSPLLFLLDLMGKRSDEDMINWSIYKARACAWEGAVELAHADEEQQETLIQHTDEHIGKLANKVAYPPGFLLPNVLSLIRYFEEKNVRAVIETLRS